MNGVIYDIIMVKLGKFGRSAEFGQRLGLFRIFINGIKIILTKQTVKILMRRLIRSRLILLSIVCIRMSQFTRCPRLPDCTLVLDVGLYLAFVNRYMHVEIMFETGLPQAGKKSPSGKFRKKMKKKTWKSQGI